MPENELTKRTLTRLLLPMLSAMVILGCISRPSTGIKGTVSLDAAVNNIRGPKRIIAVAPFSTLTSMDERYGEWELGGGMAALLNTALLDTGKFILTERTQVQEVLKEQQLASQGATAKTSGPTTGQLLGAQLMVVGAITEFGGAQEGYGVKLAGQSAGDGGSIERMVTSGTVALDIRIVDMTTGAILMSFKEEEKVKDKKLDISISISGFTVGSTSFKKTPLGEACDRAIRRAVTHIAQAAGQTTWTGYVLDYEDMDVCINAGSAAGVRRGDRFKIARVLRTFSDPSTKAIIGRATRDIGHLEIMKVEPGMAWGTYLPITQEVPKPKDLVTLVE